ncbi:MAG TPA: hypothetical protein VGM88_07365 [Kofleriaceae bacterium]|jgi:hypothetical protein
MMRYALLLVGLCGACSERTFTLPIDTTIEEGVLGCGAGQEAPYDRLVMQSGQAGDLGGVLAEVCAGATCEAPVFAAAVPFDEGDSDQDSAYCAATNTAVVVHFFFSGDAPHFDQSLLGVTLDVESYGGVAGAIAFDCPDDAWAEQGGPDTAGGCSASVHVGVGDTN